MELYKLLSQQNIDSKDIENFKKFQSRDGFVKLNDEELADMQSHFQSFEVYKDICPIMTDENSNYLCVYTSGPMKGMVCAFNHDALDLSPRFRSITNLLDTINKNPDAYDFDQLHDDSLCDFPKENETPFDREDEQIIQQLRNEFQNQSNEDISQQLAFSIMTLTAPAKLESIYSFFDHSDMYIQARAIKMMGIHRYKPALEKLIQLQTTAQHNGKTSAKYAIKRIEEA